MVFVWTLEPIKLMLNADKTQATLVLRTGVTGPLPLLSLGSVACSIEIEGCGEKSGTLD
jgi:hypothetical protein